MGDITASNVRIGDNEKPESLGAARLVAFSGKAVAISAGAAHTCAALEGGVVRCWGTTSPKSGVWVRTAVRSRSWGMMECRARSRRSASVGRLLRVSVGGSHMCGGGEPGVALLGV